MSKQYLNVFDAYEIYQENERFPVHHCEEYSDFYLFVPDAFEWAGPQPILVSKIDGKLLSVHFNVLNQNRLTPIRVIDGKTFKLE